MTAGRGPCIGKHHPEREGGIQPRKAASRKDHFEPRRETPRHDVIVGHIGQCGSAGRSGAAAFFQRYYLDVLLLVIGLIALGQLSARQGQTVETDPVLLLVPTLLFFAMSSLSLRLFPPLMNVLSGLLFVTTIWAYAWYSRCPGWRRYGLVTVLFALGHAAKPAVVPLPLLLLVLDAWPLGRFESLRASLGCCWRLSTRG